MSWQQHVSHRLARVRGRTSSHSGLLQATHVPARRVASPLSSLEPGRNRVFWRALASLTLRRTLPWLAAIILGVVVALTGCVIALNTEFLSDMRFGICVGLPLADRSRCCGGAENVVHEKCVDAPGIIHRHGGAVVLGEASSDASSTKATVTATVPPASVLAAVAASSGLDGQDKSLSFSPSHAVRWVPWEEVFAFNSSWLGMDVGWIMAMLIYVGLAAIWGAGASALVAGVAPPAKGSGIPDVKALCAGHYLPDTFSPRTLVIKSLGLAIAVGAGMALGKEGPLIHIGACWALILLQARGGGRRPALSLAREHAARNTDTGRAVVAGAPAPASPGGGGMAPHVSDALEEERLHRVFRKGLSSLLGAHELGAVGAAVGIATAFMAPLAGVLFVVEELALARRFRPRTLLLAFLGAFAATFTMKFANLNGTNRLMVFSLEETESFAKEWHARDSWAFLLLGSLGGVVGALFVRWNLAICKVRRAAVLEGRVWFLGPTLHGCIVQLLSKLDRIAPARLLAPKSHSRVRCSPRTNDAPERTDDVGSRERKLSPLAVAIIEGFVVAMVSAMLNFPISRFLRQAAPESINALFESCPTARATAMGLCSQDEAHGFSLETGLALQLLLSALIRLAQTSFTFGMQVPAGLFVPSLFVGAALGRFFGVLYVRLNLGSVTTITAAANQALIDPGVFAMVGACAVLGGFARITFSLVVIFLELTAQLDLVAPLMLAVLAARLVGDYFGAGIYDAHAQLAGYAVVEEPRRCRLDVQGQDLAMSSRALGRGAVLYESSSLSAQRLSNQLRIGAHLATKRAPKPAYERGGDGGGQDETGVHVSEGSETSSDGGAFRGPSASPGQTGNPSTEEDQMATDGVGDGGDSFSSAEVWLPVLCLETHSVLGVIAASQALAYLTDRGLETVSLAQQHAQRRGALLSEVEAGVQDRAEADGDVSSATVLDALLHVEDFLVMRPDVQLPALFALFTEHRNIHVVVLRSLFDRETSCLGRERFTEMLLGGLAHRLD